MTKKKSIVNVVIFIILALGAIVMVYPFIWMVATSLKPKFHVYLPGLLPQVIDITSYTQIWSEIPLVRGFLNTILYSTVPVLIGSFVSAGAAFAFAKINFKAKNIVFLILLGTIMIPFPSIMIPQFVLFSKLKLLATPWPLILPKLTGNILMVFFLRQYLKNVSDSIIEAAKIDGCNYFKIFYRIVLPLIIPALAAHGIMWFIGSWNDYLAPVLFIKNPVWEPVTVMVAKFNEEYAINTHVPRIMAGSVMLLIPVLIVYGIFQKWIIESIMFGSIKE